MAGLCFVLIISVHTEWRYYYAKWAGREQATLVTALFYCCKCDVNLSNQCSLTPLRRVAGGGVAVARVVRSQDGRYDRYTAEAAPPGPGRRTAATAVGNAARSHKPNCGLAAHTLWLSWHSSVASLCRGGHSRENWVAAF